jgi:hypothetical protein
MSLILISSTWWKIYITYEKAICEVLIMDRWKVPKALFLIDFLSSPQVAAKFM